MPAGDAQRVWFPEMFGELKTSWSRTMPWEEFTDFCAHMTEKRKQIRRERGIQPPKTRCLTCGKVSRSDISGVSIRSTLFALKDNGVITDGELKELDRSWMKHKKKNGLDAHGRKVAPKSTEKPVTENICGDGHGPTGEECPAPTTPSRRHLV